MNMMQGKYLSTSDKQKLIDEAKANAEAQVCKKAGVSRRSG